MCGIREPQKVCVEMPQVACKVQQESDIFYLR